VLSGRSLCDELITLPEESFRLLCVVVCDLSRNHVNEEALAHWGLSRQKERKKNKQANYWVLISVSMDRQQANIYKIT